MARMNRSVPAASWPGHVELHLNTPIAARESRNDVSSFAVRLNFHGDLSFFLRPKRRPEIIERQLAEKTSIKDVIESCGVPHPEVDLILVNGQPVDLDYAIAGDAVIEVYPVGTRFPHFKDKRLQTTTAS